MTQRDRIDAAGALALTGFSGLLAFNNVVIKVVNGGFQPVFSAGLRSLGAFLVLWAVMRLMRRSLSVPPGAWRGLLAMSAFFSIEFVFLFIALDLTDVSRAAVIFYSMPIWMALGAHLWLRDDRLTRVRALGLALAMSGVAWAILDRPQGQSQVSLIGDLCALAAAVCWAGIGLAARGTGARKAAPHVQLIVQLAISVVFLLAVSPFFGPLVRGVQPIHIWGMGFQIFIMASGGFLLWLWLLSIYPASGVASFSFLAPVFGVFLGWWLLGEAPSRAIFGALTLVALGLILINRKRSA